MTQYSKMYIEAGANIEKGDLLHIVDGKAWPVGHLAKSNETQDEIGWPFAIMEIGFFFAMAWIITHTR